MIEGPIYDKPTLKFGGVQAGSRGEASPFLVPISSQDAIFTKEYVSAYMVGLKGYLKQHGISLRHFPIVVDGDKDPKKTTLWGEFRSNLDFRQGFVEGLVEKEPDEVKVSGLHGISSMSLTEGYTFGRFIRELKKEKPTEGLDGEMNEERYERFRRVNNEVLSQHPHIDTRDIMHQIADALGETST